ncbi:hypothetical protein B0H65DRAFT_446887 [Neurospora tetraspora]|uniref:Uncharacterized protein n=1 Tax=Neurospora tetraspora TaxID=94610 RepID=A0AAE0J0B3_9PEZI|nr:hypothetical protein B0H65DRAFT_446887 [Neurospora tetraspora]
MQNGCSGRVAPSAATLLLVLSVEDSCRVPDNELNVLGHSDLSHGEESLHRRMMGLWVRHGDRGLLVVETLVVHRDVVEKRNLLYEERIDDGWKLLVLVNLRGVSLDTIWESEHGSLVQSGSTHWPG